MLGIMSQPITSPTEPQPPAPHPEPVPESQPAALKVAKLAAAFFVAIIAVASAGIGFTLMPFSPEIGGAAIAFSASMFALAGYLVYSGSGSDLSSRTVTEI